MMIERPTADLSNFTIDCRKRHFKYFEKVAIETSILKKKQLKMITRSVISNYSDAHTHATI